MTTTQPQPVETSRPPTAEARQQQLRALDSEGRHFTAPAWDGPIEQLDANELSQRVDALGAYIGRMTTNFKVLDNRFEVVVDPSAIRPWAVRRAACLNELESRASAAGVRTLDLVFASPSWKAREGS